MTLSSMILIGKTPIIMILFVIILHIITLSIITPFKMRLWYKLYSNDINGVIMLSVIMRSIITKSIIIMGVFPMSIIILSVIMVGFMMLKCVISVGDLMLSVIIMDVFIMSVIIMDIMECHYDIYNELHYGAMITTCPSSQPKLLSFSLMSLHQSLPV